MSKIEIKNIIFDWSGVIKDSVSDHLFVVNQIFKKFGAKEINLVELKENWQQPHMNFYYRYLPKTIPQSSIDSYYVETLLKMPMGKKCPGMPELVKKLKRPGKKIFVLSADSPKTLLPEMGKFGLKDIFDDVLSNVYDKTKAVGFLVDKYCLGEEDTVIIGDTNHEIEVGKKNGFKTIAVTWGYETEERLKAKRPDFIVHNPKELESILL